MFPHDQRARSERLYCLVLIVRPAPKLDLVGGCLTAAGVRRHVMELQKRGFAAASLAADERTSASVPCPDDAPDRRGNPA